MIQLKNVNKIYNKGKSNEFYALRDISLTIKDGDFMCITGKSGAGKSTLLHILGCIDSASSGSYKLNNNDVFKLSDRKLSKYRNSFFGFVMQDYALINDLSAYDNILLPALIKNGNFGNIYKRIEKISFEVGINELLNKRVNILSGGEKQRIAIARSLINNPNVLIADEPTGNLDSINAKKIYNILKSINQKYSVTVIVVTHDIDLVDFFNTQIVLNDGMITEIKTNDKI